MLRIKFTSPLIALIATCGIAGLSIGHSAYAADIMERPGGGGGGGGGHGGHSPAPGGGGGHPGGGGGGGHSPAPSPGGGFGGGHGPAPGGNPGYHPPAPTPGGGGHGPTPGGGFGGGGHNPGPTPGGHGPTPGGGFGGGGHNPGPAPGGNPGYHPPAPAPAPAPAPGGHGPTPGGGFGGGGHNPGPTPGGHGPTPGGGFGGGGHNPGPTHGGNPGGNPGYHPPAPTPGGGGHNPTPGGGFGGGGHNPGPGGNPGYHPAPTPGGGHSGGGFPGNHGNPGGYHGGMPVGHAHGPGYSYGHDNHGNIVSPVYQNHIELGRRRMDDMRNDARVRTWVDQRGSEFRSHYRPVLIRDNDRFVRYHDDYRERFRPWWNEGFYGGCYWSYHPFYDIDSYFYDPMVYWFYNNDGDDYYYRTWYGPEYDRYPVFRTHYRHVRAFYPTEEFRDLNLGMSALSIDAQAHYLQASSVLGDRLAQEVQARGGSDLDEQSVVVDHYQILPDDKGVVIEGFVDQDDVQFAFKAVQDFSNPDNTALFAATADDDVNSDRVDQLRQLNTQIEDMGGVAESDQANDGTVTAPSDDDQNTGADTPVNSDPANPDDGQTSQWDDQNSSG